MKTILYPAVLGVTLFLSDLQAQTPAEAPTPSREEVESYVTEMTRYIRGREERATRIVGQIEELDSTLNANVGRVLTMLKSSTDSQDSKTKVTRIKRDVIERIEKAAKYYATERAKLEEALRVSTNSFQREDLVKERSEFDSKINNMINMVVDLTLSMDTHQDYDKYIYENGSAFGGWNTTIRKNPEYEQNRRSTQQASGAKDGVRETLQESLDRLKVKQRDLEQQITNPKLKEESHKNVQAELDRVTALRQERIEQLYAVTSGTASSTPSPIGLRDALQMEDLIQAVAADARRDMAHLFARYRELRVERNSIADQKARLARSEKWLKDHPASK